MLPTHCMTLIRVERHPHHSAAPILPRDAIWLWELRMQLVKGRVWNTATPYQINWDQLRYSGRKKKKKKNKNQKTTNAQGNIPVQIYSRHPEVRQLSSRDALYMVLGPTLVKLTVRQAFVYISNNTLPSCLPPLCTSQTWCRWHVPSLRVIWAEEAKFVVASCFLWSATHGLAPVAKLLLGTFWGEMGFEVLPSHFTHSSTC